MGLTKTEWIFSLSIFYIVITLFVGFFGNTFNLSFGQENTTLTDNDHLSFIPSIIQTFSTAPLWFNLLFFSPLYITLSWIIITTVLGAIFDGGA